MSKKRSGRIHAANLINSDRLSSVFQLLRDGDWHGTRDIVISCDVCAVNSIIAELRDNGLRIETRCKGLAGMNTGWSPIKRLIAQTLKR